MQRTSFTEASRRQSAAFSAGGVRRDQVRSKKSAGSAFVASSQRQSQRSRAFYNRASGTFLEKSRAQERGFDEAAQRRDKIRSERDAGAAFERASAKRSAEWAAAGQRREEIRAKNDPDKAFVAASNKRDKARVDAEQKRQDIRRRKDPGRAFQAASQKQSASFVRSGEQRDAIRKDNDAGAEFVRRSQLQSTAFTKGRSTTSTVPQQRAVQSGLKANAQAGQAMQRANQQRLTTR